MIKENKNVNGCEKLYHDYLDLVEKTSVEAQILKHGDEYKVKAVSIDDILQKEALRKQLLETCKDWLTRNLKPEQLFDIENS